MIAQTPPPPYYAVIFTNIRSEKGSENYAHMAQKMVELAQVQPGFLGVESNRNQLGITISYWRDLDSIKKWKANADHLEAQDKGRSTWYSSYKTRIAKVERDYGFGDL